MNTYYYMTKRGKKFIAGCLHANDMLHAMHNARFLVKERGGVLAYLTVNKM